MSYFFKITTVQINSITQFKNTEVKLGERINMPKDNENIENFIVNTDSTFIIFGIEEDFGAFASGDTIGTKNSWFEFIKPFLNFQNNSYLKGKKLAILGSFKFDNAINIADDFNTKDAESLQKIYEVVTLINKEISFLVSKIITAGKIPVLIGGGQNIAYAAIKGASLGLTRAINAINISGNLGFGNLDGKHSGNGFSFAYDHNFLKKYFGFGVNESFLSKSNLLNVEQTKGNILFNTYEELIVRNGKGFETELQEALSHINSSNFGVEIDLNSIKTLNTTSKAISGFSLDKVRRATYFFASNKKALYLHIYGVAPNIPKKYEHSIAGVAMAYIVSDFIKAKLNSL